MGSYALFVGHSFVHQIIKELIIQFGYGGIEIDSSHLIGCNECFMVGAIGLLFGNLSEFLRVKEGQQRVRVFLASNKPGMQSILKYQQPIRDYKQFLPLVISPFNLFMQDIKDKQGLNRQLILRAMTLSLKELLNNASTDESFERTPFHGNIPPAVKIQEYVKRIQKYSYCSDSVYVMTLVYIDRLQERNPDFVLNRFSIHRTILMTFMTAAKFYDDFYFKNDYYAKIGGISKGEINSLEVSFLEMINYDLFVTPELFSMYYDKLREFALVNQGS